jgi:hypothetical protein
MAKKETAEVDTEAWHTPVPTELSDRAHERMKERGFNSKAEYVRSLMRADVEKAALDELEEKLVRALERGNFTEDSPALWKKLRAEVLDQN